MQRGAHANKRAALGLVLVGLLIAAAFDVSLSSSSPSRDTLATDSRAATVFSNADSGSCLSWPLEHPDKPSFVQCDSDHVFEVAKPVAMDTFAEPCQQAVQEYLGPRYDPNSRFTISVVWAGDTEAAPADRHMLCGLQLLGVGGEPVHFKGAVAELDQSRVWPAGTCLGADEAARRSTDTPVDCAQPHGAQVTGTVGLAERFPAGPPGEAEQDAFVRDECTRLTDAYLPGGLARSRLALEFTLITRASWAAGSRQVACRVGPASGEGWQPLVGDLAAQDSDIPVPVPAPAAPAPAPPTTTTEAPVPPVYEEPLIPLPSVATTAPAPETPATPTHTPAADVPLGPPPGPAPGEPPPPPPNVVQLPGIPPITLPFPAPPPPPPGPLP